MKNFKLNRMFGKLFLFILSIVIFFPFCFGSDILSDVFEKSRGDIIYLGNDRETVGSTILREKKEGSIGLQGYTTETKEPLIVRVVKFILKITVILSVTMVIFYSVKFMIQVFKGSDLKSAGAKKDLINLIIGLLIALFSITIIELAVSLPKNSLSFNAGNYHFCANTLLNYKV